MQAPRKTSSLQDLSPPGTRQGKQSLADEKANAQKVIHRYRAVTGRGGARLASGNLSCLTSSPSPLPCAIWQPPWLPGFSWHTPAPESSFLFSESGMSLSRVPSRLVAPVCHLDLCFKGHLPRRPHWQLSLCPLTCSLRVFNSPT